MFESRRYEFGIRNSEFGIPDHPRKTRRHEDTKEAQSRPSAQFFNAKTQRRKDAKPDHPPSARSPQITQINTDIFFDADCDNLLHRQARATHPPGFLTRRRRDAESASRRLIVRRGPGRQTARDRWAGAPLRKLAFVVIPRPAACALEERRPRLSPSSKNQGGPQFPHYKKVRARRNRHAVGVSAGEATERDERPRSERSGDSAVAGDQIAGNSAGHSSLKSSSSVTNSWCLCVFVFATRLCASASPRLCFKNTCRNKPPGRLPSW
jgi:hypothetical protein